MRLETDAAAAVGKGSSDKLALEFVSRNRVSEYQRGKTVPGERALRTLLAVADLREEAEQDAWFAARKRVISPAGPLGAVRVEQAVPRLLGVKKAIALGTPRPDAATADFLPTYIERDMDRAQGGLRARIADAAGSGGFVLLVGGSSVGKTRSAYEAIRTLLAGWWLVRPAQPADPVEIGALASSPVARTVVWLDELQRYLGPGGLSAGDVRALLGADEPVVVIGTMWPRRYDEYRRQPAEGEPDRHAEARDILELADVVTVAAGFSVAETARARVAAEHDERLGRGLAVVGYSLPEALAAGPELVDKWDTAQLDPCYRAVMTAAVDITLSGVTAPLSSSSPRPRSSVASILMAW